MQHQLVQTVFYDNMKPVSYEINSTTFTNVAATVHYASVSVAYYNVFDSGNEQTLSVVLPVFPYLQVTYEL